jgi:hypothetical protein
MRQEKKEEKMAIAKINKIWEIASKHQNSTQLLDSRWVDVTGSKSIIRFKGSVGELVTRYLTIDNEDAFSLGFGCNTCEFFFERLDGAKRMSFEQTRFVEDLNEGLGSITDSQIATTKAILPVGAYQAVLLKVNPTFAVSGEKSDYFSNELLRDWQKKEYSHNTQYYRGDTIKLVGKKNVYEFIVPLYDVSRLNSERTAFYKKNILSGKQPTCLAIGHFVYRWNMTYRPQREEDIQKDGEGHYLIAVPEHICFSNYLLDGHHKIWAASQLRKPITVLSYIYIDQCSDFDLEGNIVGMADSLWEASIW